MPCSKLILSNQKNYNWEFTAVSVANFINSCFVWYSAQMHKMVHLKNCKNNAGKFKLQNLNALSSQFRKISLLHLLEQFMKIRIFETFLIMKLGFNIVIFCRHPAVHAFLLHIYVQYKSKRSVCSKLSWRMDELDLGCQIRLLEYNGCFILALS